MKPIEIKLTAQTSLSPQEICAEFLDTERWSEFKGYLILPGIQKAHFETRTPGLVGSRIQVHNTDGSTHVEEIIAWDPENRISVRFQEFHSPLQNFASHFVETWAFQTAANGTQITRTMTLVPKGLLGWCLLVPISLLMKRALYR